MIDAIADGASPANIDEKLARLEAEQAELAQQDDTATQDIIPLSNLHQMYKDRVLSLMANISAPELRSEAIDLTQAMIDSIVVTPLPDGDRFDIELNGELGAILDLVDHNERRPGTFVSGRSLSLVAGVRHYRRRTIVHIVV